MTFYCERPNILLFSSAIHFALILIHRNTISIIIHIELHNPMWQYLVVHNSYRQWQSPTVRAHKRPQVYYMCL